MTTDLNYMVRIWRIFAAPDLEGHAANGKPVVKP